MMHTKIYILYINMFPYILTHNMKYITHVNIHYYVNTSIYNECIYSFMYMFISVC